jgi:hypothetical protein
VRVSSPHSTRSAPLAALGLCAVGLLSACGTNYVGALPPVDAGPTPDAGEGVDGGVDPAAYPAGPYGAFVGDTLVNMTFNGYVNDSPEEGLVESGGYVEGFSFQDVRTLGHYKFMLINVAAEWCQGCRVEAQQIPGLYAAWARRGGYVLSVLTETASSRPAAKRNLDAWVATYPINYTMVHDSESLISRNLGYDTLPLNVIVDLETMEILYRVFGEDFAIFQTFEGLLPP